ncbi:MAG: right-handed parallel beta-helix repeat-containing protein [bacterium]
MKYGLAIISAFLLLCLFVVPVFASSTYYVAPDGDDSNSGLSISTPFKTIQKGIDMTSAPGDTILVIPGNYTQSDNNIYGEVASFVNKHGALGNNIILKAYDPDQRPVLKGYSGIRLVNSSYITIDGFEIVDISRSGFPIYISSDLTIKNNYIHLGFDGNCSPSEIGEYAGCTYYSSLGIGEVKGRHDKNGVTIVEHDGSQNTGFSICKTINSTFSNNTIENLDESFYVGSAGNVVSGNCWSPEQGFSRTWVEGNVIENNNIINSWNEAVELKPDTRNNIVRGNTISATRQFVEGSEIDVRGHNNEITDNVIVGSPNNGIRVMSESPSDPGSDRVEAYKYLNSESVPTYMASYENNIHHNYLYSWAQFTYNANGISITERSAANIIKNNTIVGISETSGNVSEYTSIKSLSYPGIENVIMNNLMIGARRVSGSGITRGEYHVYSYAGYLPAESDFNAYYPKTKTDSTTCVVRLGSLAIKCLNNDPYNEQQAYEFHSKFMDTNPTISDESQCSRAQLLALPIEQLRDRVILCSTPNIGSPIISSANDGTNIGAYQENPSPTPTPTLTDTPTPTPFATAVPTSTNSPTNTPVSTLIPTSTPASTIIPITTATILPTSTTTPITTATILPTNTTILVTTNVPTNTPLQVHTLRLLLLIPKFQHHV